MMNFNPNHNPYPSHRSVTYGKNGMVATSQPLAAQAGLDIMKKGGNAIDAAIATAACLTVVEPISNGIGGDAFAIIWTKGELHGLNASGPAPKNISIDKVKKLGHAQMPTLGWTPVTVPGTPSAWAELSRKFGKLPLTCVLEPAIKYAREGYPVSPLLSHYWQKLFNYYEASACREAFKEWYNVFAPFGCAPLPGEIWCSEGHAKTLEAIGRSDAESFYRGELACRIVAESKANGGFFELADLADYKPEWVKPVSVNYRGYDVWELPPNGQGVIALSALNILKEFSFTTRERAETVHTQIEALKLAFTAGKNAITDWGHTETDNIAKLLSEKFARESVEKITHTATDPDDVDLPKGGTVYLCTADNEGNMVSYIQSNYLGNGAGVVIPETGIAMQNRGCEFKLNPDHANALVGGKKTYHTIIPGFLTKEGHAVGSFGVMGGYMQPQGHIQLLMNAIDFQLNPQMALDAPRFQWMEGRTVEIEKDYPTHIVEALIARGHDIKVNLDTSWFGRGQIIWRDPENNVLIGATESRCDGAVVAY